MPRGVETLNGQFRIIVVIFLLMAVCGIGLSVYFYMTPRETQPFDATPPQTTGPKEVKEKKEVKKAITALF